MLELYSKANIRKLIWPETPDADYARRMLVPIIQQGISFYIENVFNTEIYVAKLDDAIIPLTLTNIHSKNSYVCSPYSHYILYGGYEETKHIGHPFAGRLIRAALQPVDFLFQKTDFDKVVLVNNWLLSTNLYAALSQKQVQALIGALPDLFPERAIVFRSVDSYKNPGLFSQLLANDARMVLSRQVYYQNPEVSLKKKQVKIDKKLMGKSNYVIQSKTSLSPGEIQRVIDLYNDLYIKKYSSFNPQFNENFIRLTLENRLFTYQTLMRGCRMDGILAYYQRNGVMTQPIFGYDFGVAKKEGLYRLLSLASIFEAQRQGLEVHASAGVGEFKRIRGGVRVTEYNAVLDKHLNAKRRLPWTILELLSEKIAVPLFKKYGF